MNEPISNTRFVHKHCAPKPGKFMDKKLDYFLNKFVKLKFEDNDNVEYMWVKVEKIDLEKELLIGKLDNDPIDITTCKYGDIIEFSLFAICDVLSEDNKMFNINDLLKDLNLNSLIK